MLLVKVKQHWRPAQRGNHEVKSEGSWIVDPKIVAGWVEILRVNIRISGCNIKLLSDFRVRAKGPREGREGKRGGIHPSKNC
jgi:hypothetical protein